MRKIFGSSEFSKNPVWLVTFTDLVALLLAFFVMLFATQKVETVKWSALVDSLSRSLRPNVTKTVDHRFATRNVDQSVARRAIDLSYLELVLRAKISGEADLNGVLLHKFHDRLVIALSADHLFPAGGAEPTVAAKATLFVLAGVLRNIGNRLEVYGHTDPSPVPASLYPSNWELSIARADAVARALRKSGYQRDLSALGFAASRFADIRGVKSRARAYGLARRVDIVVYPNKWGAR
jgi:chemotaxis protein MotB